MKTVTPLIVGTVWCEDILASCIERVPVLILCLTLSWITHSYFVFKVYRNAALLIFLIKKSRCLSSRFTGNHLWKRLVADTQCYFWPNALVKITFMVFSAFIQSERRRNRWVRGNIPKEQKGSRSILKPIMKRVALAAQKLQFDPLLSWSMNWK